MVVQVGDKVLVYGAGTPWAFAKKIEPVQVGDKVDVVTLSDGTKLAMPKIELDLSEYVWVVPEFDTPFNIGEVPFQWGMMPLGASVFSITGVPDCTHLDDTYRSWDSNELAGCYLIPISGVFSKTRLYLIITGNNETRYGVTLKDVDPVILGYEDFIDNISVGFGGSYVLTKTATDFYILAKWAMSIYESYVITIAGMGQVTVDYRFLSNQFATNVAATLSIPGGTVPTFTEMSVAASDDAKAIITAAGFDSSTAIMNPSYPGFDTLTVSVPLLVSGHILVALQTPQRSYTTLELTSLVFGPEECSTEHIGVGDKYVIYNPVTKRLVFNDSAKLLTAANWGDTTEGSGAEIATDPVEWAWDGQGHVYLSQSKSVFSTIQYDDLLYIQAASAGAVRSIAFHLGERITVSGQTVSREFPEITSILRSGMNTITLIAKNQDGTKVGFVTPVYVKRSMTPVSL